MIVVYKDTNECKSRGPDDLKQKAKGLIGKSKANADQDPELLFIYPSINGFAAKGVNKVKLDADPCVAFTEIDQTVQLDPPEQRRSLRGLQTTTTGVNIIAGVTSCHCGSHCSLDQHSLPLSCADADCPIWSHACQRHVSHELL